jgi:membrane associated rhomboid family serine protease
MLNLWIFGDNIESIVGKLHFTLFYFLCGTIAAVGLSPLILASKFPWSVPVRQYR